MYQQFYGFTKPPFENIPDPAFLYMSPQHERALSVLKYAVLSRSGFCVITGNVGAGKTTLVRSVLYDLGQQTVVGLVSNTQCDSFEELMRWILLAFGIDYKNKEKVEMYDDFVRFLVKQRDDGKVVTLIIDEAQHLDIQILEQLRMLSNVNTERGQLLQIILVGQPELSEKLRRPEIQQFAQRISFDYFLGPLTTVESVREYIEHRLSSVADRSDHFEPETFAPIFEATRGVPRLINLVCDTALVYAFAESLQTVPLRIVQQVLDDKQTSLAPLTGAAHLRNVGREREPKFASKRLRSGATIDRASMIERAMAPKE